MNSSAGPPAERGRALTVLLWVVQLLLAAYFLALAVVPKLLGDPGAVQMFEDIGFGQWFRYFTGLCELAGVLGLLIPRLSGPAALGLLCVMVGAALANLFLIPGAAPSVVLNLLIGIVCGLIAWGRRPETRELATALKR